MGRRTRVVYTLGAPVKIRVKKTNLEQKLLDYELIETGEEQRIPRDEARAEYERTRGRVRGEDGYSDNIGSTRKYSGKRGGDSRQKGQPAIQGKKATAAKPSGAKQSGAKQQTAGKQSEKQSGGKKSVAKQPAATRSAKKNKGKKNDR